MKNIVYFVALVIIFISCKKESGVTTTSKDNSNKSLWIKFSEQDHIFNTNTILNPQPSGTRTHSSGKKVKYDFYIDNPTYPRLQVEIADYYTANNRGVDSIYNVHIYIEEAVTKNHNDGFVTTYKNSGLVPFPAFDSSFQLSFESPIVSPFSDTLKAEMFEAPDSRFFSPDDSIDLLNPSLQWSGEADNNNILSHILDHGFYAHRNHLYQLKDEDDPHWFALHHDFHEGIMGKGKKVFVFRWLKRPDLIKYYYGWIELSLSENREFTIHKVVFQVE